MKKVIIHLVSSNIYSGLEKVASCIINNLNKDYEMVYVTREGPVLEQLKKLNIKYFIIKKMSVKEIKRVINELKPDLIHAHDYRASCIASLTKTNIPIISHLHNNSPWLKTFHPYSFFYLISSFEFKKILIVSKKIQEEYIFSKYINNKYLCVNNPLNRNDILKKVNEKEIIKYDICCVGRLTKQKNPEKFIKIIYELKKDYPDIKAVWVGTGELYDKCLKLVKKYNLESNIDYVGFQDNPYKYMKESKIFMLTSRWEGYGLVLFEALTLGLPCVVSKTLELPYLIDSKIGFICDKEKEYILGVKDLLNDNIKYKLFSKNSLLKSKELENHDIYIKKIKELYESIFKET